MAEINLLPVTEKNYNTNSKVTGAAKKIGIISSVVLLIILLGYVGVYGYFYLNGTITTTSIGSLENQIKAQESTEQKIVLVRDRSAKASKILNSSTSDDEIASLSDVLKSLPEGVSVTESKILPTELTITIHAAQSSQISEFIRTLTASAKYSQIESSTIDFNTKDQYIGTFRLVLAQVQ